MPNVSLKGEGILLKKSEKYLVIDGLYFDTIVEEGKGLDLIDLNSIKKHLFPYSDAPFALIDLESGEGLKAIEVSHIIKENDEKLDKECFSTDTGLVIFISMNKISEILALFNYDNLVESSANSIIDLSYWSRLERAVGQYNIGLILSPGLNSGFEFDGSGMYRINL